MEGLFHCSQAHPNWITRVQLPEILAVDNYHGFLSRIECVKQTCIDTNPAGAVVPTSVRFKSWTIGKRGTPALRAKVMCYESRIPAISRIVAC
jgi:hypothetical protein